MRQRARPLESGTLGDTFDQRLHLCSGGRFIYDTVSYLPEAGTTATKRVTGAGA